DRARLTARVGVDGPPDSEVPLMIAPSPKTRIQVLHVLLVCAAAVAAPARDVLGEDASKLYVHLDTPGRFSYSGDPTQVSILFKNEGGGVWINPGVDIEVGFQV